MQSVYLIRADIPIIDGVSGPALARACGFELPVDAAIVDFRFLDDKSLLLLCNRGGMLRILRGTASHANDNPEEPKPALLHIAYQSANVPYREYTEGRRPPVMELDNIGDDGLSSWFGFSNASGFAPVHMEVQRANNLKGEIPARICLLGRDRMVYKIYALPEELASDRPGREARSQ